MRGGRGFSAQIPRALCLPKGYFPTTKNQETPVLLKIGLPSGSLQESTLDLFAKAGYRIRTSARSYTPSIDDPELEGLFLRAQEIAPYVERGVLDVGLTGIDWILENDADIVEICELRYSKTTTRPAHWVIAVPEDSPVQSLQDLQDRRIATELVNTTRKYLLERGVEAEVEYSWGSTEAKVRVPGLVDAIAELTETGSSLRANKLRIVETMFRTTTRFIANRQAWNNPWKREKAQNISTLLIGAFQAEDKVGLKMNVPRTQPGCRRPAPPRAQQPDHLQPPRRGLGRNRGRRGRTGRARHHPTPQKSRR